jgi:hypothetical protein
MRMMIGIGTPTSQRRIPRPMTMTFQVAASKSDSSAVAGKATAGTSSGSCQVKKSIAGSLRQWRNQTE